MIQRISDITRENPDHINRLGVSFYSEGGLPGQFKLGYFLNNWAKVIAKDVGALWKLTLDDQLVGAIGGIIFPDMNDGELVATETFWYVDKQYRGGTGGIRLLQEFENWAMSREVRRLLMTHIVGVMPDNLEPFYQKRGYRLFEKCYVRELWQ